MLNIPIFRLDDVSILQLLYRKYQVPRQSSDTRGDIKEQKQKKRRLNWNEEGRAFYLFMLLESLYA